MASAENRPNEILLRDAVSLKVLVQAEKKFLTVGSCGRAYWDIQNVGDVDPFLMTYILGLQDNRGFNCDAPTHAASESAALVVGGLGLAGVVAIVGGGVFLWKRYGSRIRRIYSGYQEL